MAQNGDFRRGKMEAELSLRHHQYLLLVMLLVLVFFCVSAGFLTCEVEPSQARDRAELYGHAVDEGMLQLATSPGDREDPDYHPPFLAELPPGVSKTAALEANVAAGELPCTTLTITTWFEYLLVCAPTVLTLFFAVFPGNFYTKRGHLVLSLLVIVNAFACTVFAADRSPAMEADLGWYATIAVLLYVYFGGYIIVQYAYPAAVAITLIVAVALVIVGQRDDRAPKYIILAMHVLVHVAGSGSLAQYERGRRLYYGWWNTLRVAQEKMSTDPGRCEQMLHLLMPLKISDKASAERNLLAENYADAAVLLLDLGGFTARCLPGDDRRPCVPSMPPPPLTLYP
jgi:hypothetical protein